MRKLKLWRLAAVLLLIAGAAQATIFGMVRGIVHDPQHRPIGGALVVLRAKNSAWSKTAHSNPSGEFTFSAVPVGDYFITVSAGGFETAKQSFTVISDSSPVLHFPLNIASVEQTAEVSAQPETVNIESTAPTTLVGRKTIQDTPGANRTNSLQMITDYVPGAYVTHDQLHVRGGHQVSWLIDGVPIPNTNIASNVGPQIDPKDIDYLEVQRGGYSAAYGDRTYGVFDVVPRTGFERNNEADVVTSFGSFFQTNDDLSFGGHSDRFAYYASANANRSNLGLETPIAQIYHDAGNGFGGFGSLIFNADPKDQFRVVSALRRDYYQIPYDPNDPSSAGLRDAEAEVDGYAILSWVRTISANALLTISPFYHYNSANYGSSPNDTPVATTDRRASNYGGMQATFSATLPRNNIQFGFYGFGQHDQLFRATFNPPNQCSATASNPNGICPAIDEEEPARGGLVAGFAEDKFSLTPWLTFMAGIRPTHFSGPVSEDAISPRFGAALRIPRLNWAFRAFYGHYYQEPPLTSISGPLVGYEAAYASVPTAFVPLHGERDEEHQFGVTIPVHGWTLDADTFETRADNFFDHNNVGESNIFIPVTIQEALIRGWELTLRSPRVWNRGEFHLAYSNQLALARGALTGGLICYPPTSPFCAGSPIYSPLDHDQRNTLNAGLNASLPWNTQASMNVYYGSGFVNGTPPPDYLPGHTTVDLTLGKQLDEHFAVSLTALNLANSHLLIDNSLTFGGLHFNDPRQIYVELHYRFHY